MKKIISFIKNPYRLFFVLTQKGYFKGMSDRTYLKLMFRACTQKKLNLKSPKTYNEKLQWLKLHDRNPLYTTLVDKYEVKKYIADKIGEDYVIPTLGVWDSFDEIDFDSLPEQFVLKCTHDSGGLVICRDKSTLDLDKARDKITKSLKTNYFWHAREWPYKNVKPRIIAEEYISPVSDDLSNKNHSENSCLNIQRKHGLLDYKFMCFDGHVKALFLDIGVIGNGTDHAHEYYRNVYDESGNLLSCKETRDNYPTDIELPDNLNEMVQIAEKLSVGIPHVRVDLYNLDGKQIKVGELTFYHGAGLSNTFIPENWDETFGSWIKLP